MKVVPYEPAHAYDIIDRNCREANLWISEVPNWEEAAIKWQSEGPGYTLISNGNIIASAGVTLSDWNNGLAWALLSTLFHSHVKSTFRAIKEGLGSIVEEYELKRVEMLVDPNSEEAQNFAKHLGFEQEGLRRKLGPNGEDYLMYARVY